MFPFASSRRIIIIDDQPDIHADFRKILGDESSKPMGDLARLRAAVKGTAASATSPRNAKSIYAIESALQGEEGVQKIVEARQAEEPFSLAFIDMRMPPGWDGLRTMSEIWDKDPDIQMVICTAFSDHPWSAIDDLADRDDRVLVLKKPFDVVEIKRMAATLTSKWRLTRENAARRIEMESQLRRHEEIFERERSAHLAQIKELEERVLTLTEQTHALVDLVNAAAALPNQPADKDPSRYSLDLNNAPPDLR